MIEALLIDIKLGFRQVRRSPGLALTAVLTLALGIVANTAIFSVVDGIFVPSFAVATSTRGGCS